MIRTAVDASPAATVRLPRAPRRVAPASAAERRRLEDRLEPRQMLDRRTLAAAGPLRHPRWARYPNGAADHAALLLALEGDGSAATLLMETYGALDVPRRDAAAGIERRTGGGVPVRWATAVLRRLGREA